MLALAMLSDTRPPPESPLPRHEWWSGELAASSVATDARQVSGTEGGWEVPLTLLCKWQQRSFRTNT